MDKQKQIEEMANIMKSVTLYGDDNYRRKISNDSYMELAEELLKHYQPKIPEGSVVLTKEKYEQLCKDKNDYKQRYGGASKQYEQLVQSSCEALEKGKDQARKQAVKEVLSELKKVWKMRAKEYNTLLGNKVQAVTLDLIIEDIEQTAEDFGVEL